MADRRIYIKPSAFLVWGSFLFFDRSVYTAILFGTMALHECGHLMALWLFGVKDIQMTVSAFGAEIRYHTVVGSAFGRILIALGGVFMNLLTAGVLWLWSEKMIFLYGAVASLVLAILNLMPVKGLDGGWALEEILACYADFHTSYTVMRVTSCVSVALLGILSVAVLIGSGFNFSLLLFTLYLSLSLFRL